MTSCLVVKKGTGAYFPGLPCPEGSQGTKLEATKVLLLKEWFTKIYNEIKFYH